MLGKAMMWVEDREKMENITHMNEKATNRWM